MRILVLGARGYIGSRLVPELLARGHEVVASTRRPDRAVRYPWGSEVRWRRIDLHDPPTLRGALDDIDALAYLAHGLDDRDFRDRDRTAAATLRRAADTASLPRLVYLSGIVPDVPDERLSEHLLSRFEVEEELLRGAAASLALRAAVVVGSGSASFEVVRQLSRRLPVQPVPLWMWASRVQPVAVVDVVRHLADALDGGDEQDWLVGSVDVAGPDVLTYRELLELYAEVAGWHRLQVPIWGLPSAVVGPAAGLLTDVDATTVAALVRSLAHDMVAAPGSRAVLGDSGRELVGLREALARASVVYDPARDGAAVGADPLAPSAGDPGWSPTP